MALDQPQFYLLRSSDSLPGTVQLTLPHKPCTLLFPQPNEGFGFQKACAGAKALMFVP